MKKVVFILTATFLLLGYRSSGQTEPIDTTYFQDSCKIIIKKINSRQFLKTTHYKSGAIQSEVYLDKKGYEKKSIEYYENGNTKTKVIRKGLRGLKHKIIEWDENGNKTSGTYIE
jgi:antitoxin component YwqK of YwqJK toxin-antitoxin module